MKREVLLTETAHQQMNAAADWYAERNPSVSATWFNGLIAGLNSAAYPPLQHSLAGKCELLPFELRQFLYGIRWLKGDIL